MEPILTFDHDQLNLKSFAKRFEDYLLVEHDFVEGSLVTALDGAFGSGKSTLLSMWKADLARRKSETPETPLVISLNSWEEDFCGDPLLSIIGAFLKAIPADEGGEKGGVRHKIREAVKDVFWIAAALGNGAVSQFTGVNLMEAGSTAESKKQARTSEFPDFVALYERRTKALDELRKSLYDAFGGTTVKAIVFVDELDRCRPDFAIQYLETIKHVFNIHGLAFVLAIDQAQLACSAKTLFGRELNTTEYFRKFIHRTVILPQPTESGLQRLTATYVRSYLSVAGKRNSKLHSTNLLNHISELLAGLKLNPRQAQEVFRTIGHATQTQAESASGTLLWGYSSATLLMAALRVANFTIYTQIGRGFSRADTIADFLVAELGSKNARWWVCIYLVGSASEQDPLNGLGSLFKRYGWNSEGKDDDVRAEIGRFWEGFGHFPNEPFKNIYSMLEALASFENPAR